jgi:hypothetical protein
LKLRRIISLATLAISVFTFYLVLKRPAQVAVTAVSPATVAANAQSFQEKVSQIEQPRSSTELASEVRINSAELSAALGQAAGMMTASATSPANGNESLGAPARGASGEFPGAVPDVKDYQVSMDGDIVRGQFLTQIAGQDVYITLGGHLGAKDGYATFDATEAKVGDLSVPVSLVNEALQRKLAEQRDQLKLPDNVKDIKIENGELVLVPR